MGAVSVLLFVVIGSTDPSTDHWITAEERSKLAKADINNTLDTANAILDSVSADVEDDGEVSTHGWDGLAKSYPEAETTDRSFLEKPFLALPPSPISPPSPSDLREKLLPSPSPTNAMAEWRLLLTSRPLWAVYAVNFSVSWLSHSLSSELPSYMDEELGFAIQDAGYLLVGLYAIQWLSSVGGGYVADQLITRGFRGVVWGLRHTRLVFTVLTCVGSAACVTLAAYSGRAAVVVAFLYGGSFFQGLSSGGFRTSFVDLAPHASSSAFAFANTLGSFAGTLTPLVLDALLTGGRRAYLGWHAYFVVSSCLNLAACAVYYFEVSAEPIPGL
jgi:hypothetical protein